MFNHNHNQENLQNSNSSIQSVAHQLNNQLNNQLNESNTSFQLNASNHNYLTNEDHMNLSQTYTAYNSLSNHHSNTNSHSNSVLNSYYNSASNFQTVPTPNDHHLNSTRSQLMNTFMNDNYSVNSLVSKSSSGYSSDSSNFSLNNHFKQTASIQKSSNTNLISKINSHHQNDSYSTCINRIENYGAASKKTALNYGINNSTMNNLSLTNFKVAPNNQFETNQIEHNLGLIKSSIGYENSLNTHLDVKPKPNLIDSLTNSSIYNDLNGIRNNSILFELTKNCSSQNAAENSNGFSPNPLNYTAPNKLIQSLNSTGSTCSTMSSPTLSN